MALRGHNVNIFTEGWVNALADTPEAAMAAEIRIFSRGKPVYDPVKHEYVAEETTHYTGKARVQPIRMEVQTYQLGNPTSIQNIRVQIPIKYNFDIKLGMIVEVTEAPLNEVLKGYTYNVSKIADSSNPIERSFQCTIDQEVRDNG